MWKKCYLCSRRDKLHLCPKRYKPHPSNLNSQISNLNPQISNLNPQISNLKSKYCMLLIADSGSTKTEWSLVKNNGEVVGLITQGINPFYQTDEDIVSILRYELLDMMEWGSNRFDMVCFYGAGVRPEMKSRMSRLLTEVLAADHVTVDSDLVGAARALFGHDEGIACILGTGSNSGLYDGRDIVASTPPLGFILGDEGSGAVLGKQFLGALYKGLMPEGMREDYERQTGQTVADVILAVYRKPLPNRYLAHTSEYILQHIDVQEVSDLVIDSFRQFFRRNLSQYQRKDLPVRTVGSVAAYYSKWLTLAAEQEGYIIDKILKNPMPGLIEFHIS